MNNIERISLDKTYLENLVFKLNHDLYMPHQPRLEQMASCSKYSSKTLEILLKTFLKEVSSGKGVKKNLITCKYIKEIKYSPEEIQINIIYPLSAVDKADVLGWGKLRAKDRSIVAGKCEQVMEGLTGLPQGEGFDSVRKDNSGSLCGTNSEHLSG